MSLEEAKKILDVKELDEKEILEKYKKLLEANEKSGSFYLASKVYRAKERIDLEIKNPQEDSAN